MRIYTYRRQGGERIEADINVGGWYGGPARYSVGEFKEQGAGASDFGWRLLPRTYKSLAGLLAAVERVGFYVDIIGN